MMYQIELLRHIVDDCEELLRLMMDHYLNICDAAYTVARSFYRNVREAQVDGDVRAQTLFNDLRTYYERQGRRHRGELTVEELVKDFKGVLTGKKVGEIKASKEPDRVIEGKKKVVDKTRDADTRTVTEEE